MAGRSRVLLRVLAPVSALSVVVVVRPRPSAASSIGPAAVLTVAVLLAVVAWSAWSERTRRRPGDLLQTADWVASVPLAFAGWAAAAFALLAVSATSHLPGLGQTDGRQWLLLALPLWVVVAGSEWFILAARRALAAELEASHSVVGFRRAARRLVRRRTALGAVVLAVAVVVGAIGARASGIPFAAACTAGGVIGAVAAALFGATVLVSAAQVMPVLSLMAGAAAVLGWLALSAHNPLGPGDHWAGLAVAGSVAAVLCVGAGRALIDPANHR